MSHAQRLDECLHAFANRGRAAGNDIALVNQFFPGQVRKQALHLLAQGVEHIRLEGLDRTIARRVGKTAVDVQAAVIEIADVLGVHLFGLLVGIGHADSLGKCRPIGRLVFAAGGHAIPIAVQQFLPAQIAGEGQIGIVVVVIQAEVPGFDRAATGDIDGRIRLLNGLGPQVDIAELVVFAVKGERFFLVPGTHDQVVRFGIFIPGQTRNLAVAIIGVHRGPDRKAGQQATAGNDVQHGKFFGNPQRRVVQGQ